ncbi:hypothetical protein [Dehalobacterium formicoaceticum]|uniref:hypothetical protein n=1 Tax=Dehalobacterium formicoaceticum TaxID=51515 RepID=UPI0031F6808E
MTDRELLELIVAKLGSLTDQVGNNTEQIGSLTSRMDELESDVKNINQTVTRVEHDHGSKLAALLDGYKLNTEKLDRIEAEVSKHDKFIMERIK